MALTLQETKDHADAVMARVLARLQAPGAQPAYFAANGWYWVGRSTPAAIPRNGVAVPADAARRKINTGRRRRDGRPINRASWAELDAGLLDRALAFQLSVNNYLCGDDPTDDTQHGYWVEAQFIHGGERWLRKLNGPGPVDQGQVWVVMVGQ